MSSTISMKDKMSTYIEKSKVTCNVMRRKMKSLLRKFSDFSFAFQERFNPPDMTLDQRYLN